MYVVQLLVRLVGGSCRARMFHRVGWIYTRCVSVPGPGNVVFDRVSIRPIITILSSVASTSHKRAVHPPALYPTMCYPPAWISSRNINTACTNIPLTRYRYADACSTRRISCNRTTSHAHGFTLQIVVDSFSWTGGESFYLQTGIMNFMYNWKCEE